MEPLINGHVQTSHIASLFRGILYREVSQIRHSTAVEARPGGFIIVCAVDVKVPVRRTFLTLFLCKPWVHRIVAFSCWEGSLSEVPLYMPPTPRGLLE